MTTQEWKALIRMTQSTSKANTYLGHYKGVPVELTSNSTLTQVTLMCNPNALVTPKSFMMDDELPSLYRKVFRALYDTWYSVYSVTIDNLPF